MYYPMMNIRSSHPQVIMLHNTSIYIAVFLPVFTVTGVTDVHHLTARTIHMAGVS